VGIPAGGHVGQEPGLTAPGARSHTLQAARHEPIHGDAARLLQGTGMNETMYLFALSAPEFLEQILEHAQDSGRDEPESPAAALLAPVLTAVLAPA
jgi:hypothetical protein